jgi:hypothetical protein
LTAFVRGEVRGQQGLGHVFEGELVVVRLAAQRELHEPVEAEVARREAAHVAEEAEGRRASSSLELQVAGPRLAGVHELAE